MHCRPGFPFVFFPSSIVRSRSKLLLLVFFSLPSSNPSQLWNMYATSSKSTLTPWVEERRPLLSPCSLMRWRIGSEYDNTQAYPRVTRLMGMLSIPRSFIHRAGEWWNVHECAPSSRKVFYVYISRTVPINYVHPFFSQPATFSSHSLSVMKKKRRKKWPPQ